MNRITSREKLFVGIFVITAAWGAWNYRHVLSGPIQDDAAPARPAAVATAEAPAPSASAGHTAEPASGHGQAMYRPPGWGADPFNRSWRKPAAAAGGTQTIKPNREPLILTALVVRPDIRLAVINGRLVREGERIAGRTILSIEDSLVRVDDNGIEVTLSL